VREDAIALVTIRGFYPSVGRLTLGKVCSAGLLGATSECCFLTTSIRWTSEPEASIDYSTNVRLRAVLNNAMLAPDTLYHPVDQNAALLHR
jgi:hypothetical protein